MSHLTQPTVCAFLLLSILASASCSADEYFVLRNPHSGLVLDASEGWVILQKFTGFSTQLWRLDPTRDGLNYIVSKNKGKVLDLDYRYKPSRSWVVVNSRSGTPGCPQYNGTSSTGSNEYCQQWRVHYDGGLVNACGKFGVTIMREEYKVGAYLEMNDYGGGKNQKFTFQYL